MRSVSEEQQQRRSTKKAGDRSAKGSAGCIPAALRKHMTSCATKHSVSHQVLLQTYRRIRDECLNINSFYSLLHAQVIIGDWKDEYNHHRRHSSLGYLPPAEYARQCTHQMETDDSQNVRTE